MTAEEAWQDYLDACRRATPLTSDDGTCERCGHPSSEHHIVCPVTRYDTIEALAWQVLEQRLARLPAAA